MKEKDINPSLKPDGFWSACLHRFIKRNPHYNKVYRGSDGHLYIGHYDPEVKDLSGSKLRAVCCGSEKRKFRTCCFVHLEFEDVNDWFWSEYERIGVCAIHGDYGHAWAYCEDERECCNCGKTEKKHIEMVPREFWK